MNVSIIDNEENNNIINTNNNIIKTNNNIKNDINDDFLDDNNEFSSLLNSKSKSELEESFHDLIYIFINDYREYPSSELSHNISIILC